MASSMMLALRLNRFSTLCRNTPRCLQNYVRAISTSNETKDSSVVPQIVVKRKAIEGKIEKKKDWVSYGYDYDSEFEDRLIAHVLWFCALSMCIIGGGFLIRYYPDFQMRDWATREAFLELHRREVNGLPLIDEDLIPRDKIILPTEEELENTEIII